MLHLVGWLFKHGRHQYQLIPEDRLGNEQITRVVEGVFISEPLKLHFCEKFSIPKQYSRTRV